MSVFARRCLSSVLYQVVQRKNLVGVSCGNLLRNMRSDSAQGSIFSAPASNLRSLCHVTNCYYQENRFPKANDSLAWKFSGVRKLHTVGDQDLANFLNDEIKIEKKRDKKFVKIKDFEVSKTDGPCVVLTRKLGNEIITARFNINNSLDMVPDCEDAKSSEMRSLSRPKIVVEINKGGDKILAVNLDYETLPELQTRRNQVTILDVTMLSKSQDWTEEVYSHEADLLNANLYDKLVNLLKERGITDDFLDQVFSFCTTYEHDRYVEFLEKLENFADSK